MRKKILILLLFFCSIILFSETIESILIEGNKKVARDTVLFYMRSKPNGIYSREILRKDFKILWETGFFKKIEITSRDGNKGKIVKIKIEENPIIASITYNSGKKISQDDISEKLREENIILSTMAYFSEIKVNQVSAIIKNLLLEKGYYNGKVDILQKKNDKGNILLTINVKHGPKTRVGRIAFPGIDKKKLSETFLRKGMKNNRPHGLLTWITAKDIYKPEKISEDLEEIKLRLQRKGYLEAKVGKPKVSMINKKTALGGKIHKMIQLSIPIEIGPQYKFGNLKIQGNEVIKTSFIKQLITLKKGKVYNVKKRNDNIEEIQKFYRSIGYFWCQVTPQEDLDPLKMTADLTLVMHEGKIAYLGKIDFVGNTFTKDHVLRREWFLREGDRLSSSRLEDSIKRMRQLGLVDISEMPKFEPEADDPTKINLKVRVKELHRQMINFNFGYSGYDGLFIALGYSTKNFLGMGETLAINLQEGQRAKNYRFAFTEPRLFHLPANAGIDVFKTQFEYPLMYTRKGQGFNVMTSARFWRYFGMNLAYRLEFVEISDVHPNISAQNSYYLDFYGEGGQTISSIMPTIYYNTVDSPIFPTSGMKIQLDYRYSGGIFGGDINMQKYTFKFIKYFPLKNRTTFGMQLVYQGLTNFGDKPIPYWEKFYLGGERSIRGFYVYRIGPKSEYGYVIGGTKAFHANFEFHLPITEQLTFITFYDVGNAYDVGVPLSLDDVYQSMGVELKIFIPMLNIPFRLIFAYNPRLVYETESHFAFMLGVGPSFY